MAEKKQWWKFWEKGIGSDASANATYIQLMLSINTAYWTGRDFLAFAQEGYRENPTVRACVDLISKGAVNCPIIIKNENTDVVTRSHPLLDLLQKPNEHQHRNQFITQAISNHLIGGEGDIWANRVVPGRAPQELVVLRPDWLEARRIGGNYPTAWYYAPDDGTPTRIEVDDLLVWAAWHPLDRVRGLSPLYSAARAIDTLNEYAKTNMALVQNGMRPSGVLSTPNNLSDPQFNRLKEELQDAHQGSANSGKPFIAEGGITWQQTGLSPQEMEYIQGKNLSELDVCKILHVPAQCIGLPGSQTFANYEQARCALYEDAIIPLFDDFLSAVSNWLGPCFKLKPGEKLCVDIERVAALEPRRAERNKNVDGMQSLSTNEKRHMMGQEPVPGGEELLVQNTLIPLQDAGVQNVPPPNPSDAAGNAGLPRGKPKPSPVPAVKPPK